MSFYLVQRLKQAYPDNGKTGFDRLFSLDYMGSSEYEWGTPNACLKEMRAKPLVVFHHEVTTCGDQLLDEAKPVFFVARKDGLLDKITAFEKWLSNPKRRNKEGTYFPEVLSGTADEYKQRVVAWWSFDDDIAWTLDPETAHTLRAAFANKEVTPRRR